MTTSGDFSLDEKIEDFLNRFSLSKVVIVLFIISSIVYFNSLSSQFVWDDKSFIVENFQIRSFSFVNIFGPSMFNNWYYRPIPALYLTSLYSVFKESPIYYHVFQVILHTANTIFLFVLFKRFFNNKVALFLSSIFLIHPIQVESVVFISPVSPLFFLFGIMALLLSQKDNVSWKRLFLIFGFLLLSLLTKETGIIFLFIIILSRLLIQRKNTTIFLLFGFITSALYLLIRLRLAGVYFSEGIAPMDVVVPIAQLNLTERLLNIPAIVLYYLKTFFLPVHLAIDQQWIITTPSLSNFYFPLILDLLFFLILILLGSYILRVNKKSFEGYIFFLLWFLAGFFMHIQVFPLNMTVADRWFYFPMVGLLGIIGVGVQSLKISDKNIRIAGYVGGVTILTLLMIRTIVRNADWRNGITLYTHDSRVSNNATLENNLGTEYSSLGNYNEALIHYKKSVEMYPMGGNLFNLGNTYDHIGDTKIAEDYFTKAINFKHPSGVSWSIAPGYLANSYIGLVKILIISERPETAREVAKEGIKACPDCSLLWVLLATTEYKLNNYKEALAAAEKAKMLAPNGASNYIYMQILNRQPVKLKSYGSEYWITP